ncbi:MAG: bifunctional ADP-dependent NAD(P)H-hydrate dehydratase/NAD(P)H-hydrate epimerase [Pseudonocardia sp.]|nr:bifunctional ADP-dependent NAD(P)H-hydrate dehydratase/NAD(P)H-hydrate epimerase [Pseudonocardia sp.]
MEAFPVALVRQAQESAASMVRPGKLLDCAVAGITSICWGAIGRLPRTRRPTRLVALAGSGMNGADALLVTARLRSRGLECMAVLVKDSAYGPGLAAARDAGVTVIDATTPEGLSAAPGALGGADVILDGIVGLGGVAGLRGAAKELVRSISARALVIALDLPSGVDPDSGETPGPHIRADLTIAIGALAPCLLLPPATRAAGNVLYLDNGFRPHLHARPVVARLSRADAGTLWPGPTHDDHKYTRGTLGVVAGSATYPGAALLACSGAVLSGAGVVRYSGPSEVRRMLVGRRPEVVPGLGRPTAHLLGSGIADDAVQRQSVLDALSSGTPCLVDAEALDLCVERRAAGRREVDASRMLLTPHTGELARLFTMLGDPVTAQEVRARPWHYANELANRTDTTVLLKGSTTIVASPGGRGFSQADGPPWLATAGSGDVLAGIAGALLASGMDAATAGALAAQVHGLAAHLSCPDGPAPAGRVADALPRAVATLIRRAGSTIGRDLL